MIGQIVVRCILAVSLCLFLGCNDENLRLLETSDPPPRDGSSDAEDPPAPDDAGDDDDEDGGGGPYDDGDPEDDVVDDDDDTSDDDGLEEEPPPLKLNECPEGAVATFAPDEIYVLSWQDQWAEGTLSTDAEGWYHVYDFSVAESGDSQWNETVSFRVTNATNPTGAPYWENCDGEWWVEDADNDGSPPPGAVLYIGTFWLDSGDNSLQMNHYCPVYRDGNCTSFHRDEVPESTCDSGNVNSAHFLGEGICLVEAHLPGAPPEGA
ncbi:MAG TPA: hypothetical protein DIU15_04330 [Deltaproteobacteria bacterium]|nr:hypothetical protein [Deltaproteobacteria bacterium]HCP45240.1 hypothetical protein [Deltaproteobacteria bacterium]